MQVGCTQCGASLNVGQTERLLQCPYCDTALVVDGSGTLFHEAMVPTIRPEDTAAHLRRFLGGRDTVANLDRDVDVEKARAALFESWPDFSMSTFANTMPLPPAATRRWREGLHKAGFDFPKTTESGGYA